MSPARIRSGASVTAVQGSVPKLGQTPLIQVTVKGPQRGRIAVVANALANALAFQLSSGARQKIAIYEQQVRSDEAGLKIVNDALAKSDLSTTDKILLQGRQQTLQSDKTLDGAAAHLREERRGGADRHVRRAGEVVRAQPSQLHCRRRADRADPRRHRGAALGSGRPGSPPRAVTSDARRKVGRRRRSRVPRGGADRRDARRHPRLRRPRLRRRRRLAGRDRGACALGRRPARRGDRARAQRGRRRRDPHRLRARARRRDRRRRA